MKAVTLIFRSLESVSMLTFTPSALWANPSETSLSGEMDAVITEGSTLDAS